MKTSLFFSAIAVCVFLASCSANTEETTTAQPKANTDSSETQEELNVMSIEQMNELRRTRTVEVVFTPAGGSVGNGEVMRELKAINGPLREPNLNYDVFDPQSNLNTQEVKQAIEISLDTDRRVLIDNGGTAESRAKAAELITAIVGGSIPDTAGTIILRAPEHKGGGYLTIPIYSKADVQNQISQGRIPNAESQANSIENFFFEPKVSK